ncbi:flagellar hook protein [Roseburia sp. MUC/MUC-530-WT-4D]|uniref:Flagellin n=1 Tax=Roseburia porci TaxID=2605790 RepID=A0A6L5YNM3_9FIRM|nr:flagellin [Roseburia porci]MST73767.1 flagellar hook protein [Roseburia porci]
MVVQHNMQAMNANRMLGVTTSAQSKSTEKLSSGYRINRAADDAAGLSISEKMRKQIRGLSQASDNAQDGISCVQTAEGALTEVHSMLQRMNELAVKAGNGTMSEDDRQNVQDEIDQLVTEIDRVSETTKFNETYLLKGDKGNGNGNETTKAGGAAATTVDTVAGVAVAVDATKTAKFADGDHYTAKVGVKTDSTKLTIGTNAGDETKAANVKSVTCTDATNGAEKYSLTMQDGSVKTGVAKADLANYGFGTTVTLGKDETANVTKTLTDFTKEGEAAAVADVTLTGDYTGSTAVGETTDIYAAVAKDGTVKLTESAKALTLSFQVGAETDTKNKIDVQMESMSAKSIGVDGVKVTGTTSANADSAVNTISDAIKKVSSQRSALGAVQNRLEHTISNLDNVVENTTSAESRIRDTDMAEEMVNYSKNNILAQAGQSMLAQANQSTQGVLSLLQ